LKHQKTPWVWHLGDAVPYHLCSSRQLPGFPTEEFWGRPIPGLVEAFSREFKGTYICCANRLAAEIAGYGIQMRGSMHVVPYWFHAVRATRRTEYLEGGTLRIVSAGALGPHKGTDILIEAAAALRDGGRTNFTLDLYGAVDSPTWQLLIDKLDLRAHVRLRGARPQAELALAYRTCDLFAFPTWRREPFGVGPLEAGAQGCVSILSESCGIAEWMVDGVDCIKAKRTVEGFRDGFASVMDGEIDLASLGARVTNTVWRDFHLDAVVPSIESLLREAAEAPREAPGRPAEAYSIALMAEKMAHVVGQQTLSA
jgi:glycosyltransferase involved in cell wall biosynthesis